MARSGDGASGSASTEQSASAPMGADVPPGLLLPGRQKAMILAAVMLALFLAALDSTIIGVALPRIVADLGGLDLFAWPITAYMLTSTVTVPVVGRLSDIYGRKPFMVGGLVVFLAGSAMVGTSGSMTELILFRAFQGLGAGVVMANAFTILGDLFAPAERARWMGIVAGVFALASVIGPLLGGFITDNLSWRWVFYINLPLGAIALPAVLWQMPWFRQQRGLRVDYLGGFLVMAAGTLLLLGVSWGGSQYGWGEAPVVGTLAGAALLIALFIAAERRAGEHGVMPLGMFRNRVFVITMIVSAATGLGMFGVIQFMPLFLQGAQGVSASNSGTVTMPFAVGIVLGSISSGQLMARTGMFRPVTIVGGALMVAGALLLSTLEPDSSRLATRGYMFMIGLGLGLSMPLFNVAVQNAMPHRLLGVATASTQFFRQVGGTIGVAIFGSIMASQFASKLAAAFPSGVDELRNSPQLLLNPDRLAQFRASLEAETPGSADAVIETARNALSGTITDLFMIGAAVMLVALAVMPLMPRMRVRTRADMLAAAEANASTGEASADPSGADLGDGLGDDVSGGGLEGGDHAATDNESKGLD